MYKDQVPLESKLRVLHPVHRVRGQSCGACGIVRLLGWHGPPAHLAGDMFQSRLFKAQYKQQELTCGAMRYHEKTITVSGCHMMDVHMMAGLAQEGVTSVS